MNTNSKSISLMTRWRSDDLPRQAIVTTDHGSHNGVEIWKQLTPRGWTSVTWTLPTHRGRVKLDTPEDVLAMYRADGVEFLTVAEALAMP